MTAPTSTTLPPVVAEYLAAVNAFDLDRMVATFAEDAYVNDARYDGTYDMTSLLVMSDSPEGRSRRGAGSCTSPDGTPQGCP
ncbi:hypothetical protein [Arthrobacter sp. MMS24-S77]